MTHSPLSITVIRFSHFSVFWAMPVDFFSQEVARSCYGFATVRREGYICIASVTIHWSNFTRPGMALSSLIGWPSSTTVSSRKLVRRNGSWYPRESPACKISCRKWSSTTVLFIRRGPNETFSTRNVLVYGFVPVFSGLQDIPGGVIPTG